ncbi:hypothetical protein C8Q76DRAFT_204487 [Earliella scabrosa]|nr:hypothetical protein C8Q76DRAFT_204487 [Earliella scabrosa]
MASPSDIEPKVHPSSGDIPAIQVTISWGLVGLCISLLFYGIVLCQTSRYFRTYPKDAPILKTMVVIMIVAETTLSVFGIHSIYFYLIQHNGEPEAYTTPTVSIALLPVNVVVIFAVSEFFYIRRVYLILPRPYKYIFVVLAGSLVLVTIGFTSVLTTQIFVHGEFKYWLHYKWLVSAAYAPPAAGDPTVAVVLVVALHRSHTGIKRTDALLNKLKIYAFSTGLVASLLSVTCLVVDMLDTNLIIIPFSLIAANVNAFSMLVTLHIRKELKDNLEHDDFPSEWLHLSALQRTQPTQGRARALIPSGLPDTNIPMAMGSMEVMLPSQITDTGGIV